MGSRPAPTMPTPNQIRLAHETVRALYPHARIKAVGPDGVTFEYPDAANAPDPLEVRPFSA